MIVCIICLNCVIKYQVRTLKKMYLKSMKIYYNCQNSCFICAPVHQIIHTYIHTVSVIDVSYIYLVCVVNCLFLLMHPLWYWCLIWVAFYFPGNHCFIFLYNISIYQLFTYLFGPPHMLIRPPAWLSQLTLYCRPC